MVIFCSRSAFRPSVIREKSISPPLPRAEAFRTAASWSSYTPGVVEQPPDQRRLPVVDASYEGEAQQVGVGVLWSKLLVPH
jgi:hypothetical protein